MGLLFYINNMEHFGFKTWDKTPNTIDKNARVMVRYFYVDVPNKDKNRLIRIYLPSTYDFDNPLIRFPVLYMMDGKNLFDDYTSFVGEWGVDETIEEMIKNKTSKGIIVVGIDSAKTDIDRTLEMLIPHIETKFQRENRGYSNILGDFIFNELKPFVDEHFHTLSDKENTGVGGSSMGGLMAFYLGEKYRDKVGFSLCFSPAFFLYKKRAWEEYLKANIINKDGLGKFYFYVGGVGFESEFVSLTISTYEYFQKIGFTDKEITLVVDETKEHNEKAWREYFPLGINFWINDKN